MSVAIFASPKPFRGLAKVQQMNALHSWASIVPTPEILLMGDAEGTFEAARAVGARHLPDIPLNEFGTPLVNGLFAAAETAAANSVLCYVNSDIMLTGSFLRAVASVPGHQQRYLLTGRRYQVSLEIPWDFADPGWQQALNALATRTGHLDSWIAADYFAFPRKLRLDIPAFALGRTTWDNWLLYRARAMRIPVIDATRYVLAVHPRHDYSHHPEGAAGVWKGPEAARNLELAGGARYAFSIADATHVLTGQGALRPAVHPVYLWRRAYSWAVLYPPARPVRAVLDVLLALSKPFRKRIGWTLGPR